MKLKNQKPAKTLPVNSPKIKLNHGQSIKQSINYQSAECSFSAELVVDDTPKSVRRGIKRLEKMVEEALAVKVTQQQKFLYSITEQQNETANKAAARRSRF